MFEYSGPSKEVSPVATVNPILLSPLTRLRIHRSRMLRMPTTMSSAIFSSEKTRFASTGIQALNLSDEI